MQDGRGEHAQQNAKEQAEHRYYRHGALKRTELGRDLQGMDYVYTIQGWLKAINSPDEQWRDPGDDGVENSVNQAFSPDLFGMSLDYFSEDYTRANTGISTHLGYTGEPAPQYSGLVRAQRWNNRALGEEPLTAPGTPLMYAYAYDVHGQLVKAQLGQVYSTQQGGSPTVYLGEDHKVFDIAYDKNGNLTQLKRNGTAAIAQGMDLLTYHYPVDPNSQRTNNRLDRVTDTGSDHHDYLGFGLLSGQNAGNYSYNALGQLTGDVREGKTYTYYANGRIKDVAITAAVGYQPVSFAYDAAGNRVQKVTYDTDGTTPLQRTWYLRDATGAVRSYLLEDVVEETFTAELPIPGVGTYLRASEQVRYEISDHLGNTRVSFTRDEEGEPLVLEAHDYYPHGGLMPGRQLNGSAGSPLAYQGQEFDKEVGLSAFNLRQYDARLGRWLTPDPYAQHYSPYLGMSNNPVSFTDPDGGYDQLPNSNAEWRAYYLAGKDEFTRFSNSVRSRNAEGERNVWDSWSNMGSGFDADGQARDMDGMIRLAGMARSLSDDAQMGYNSQRGQWGYLAQEARLGAPNVLSSHAYDRDRGYGFDVDLIRAWNGVSSPSMSASSGMGSVVFSSTLRSGRDGPSAIPSPMEFVENTATIVTTVIPVGLLYRGAKIIVSGLRFGKAPVVIGETVARVEKAASKIPGAKTLDDMPDFGSYGLNPDQVTSKMMEYNRKWILDQLRSGRQIIDIGRDINRARPSIFYEMEQNMIKNYLKLHP